MPESSTLRMRFGKVTHLLFHSHHCLALPLSGDDAITTVALLVYFKDASTHSQKQVTPLLPPHRDASHLWTAACGQ